MHRIATSDELQKRQRFDGTNRLENCMFDINRTGRICTSDVKWSFHCPVYCFVPFFDTYNYFARFVRVNEQVLAKIFRHRDRLDKQQN